MEAPLGVIVKTSFAHINPPLTLMVGTGISVTLAIAGPEAAQPAELVPVTEYVALLIGTMVGVLKKVE